MEPVKSAARALSLILAFCAALALGFLKGLFVGPIAALVLIVGNYGVLIALSPAHAYWVVYTLLVTDRVNIALKLVLLVALPVVYSLWLAFGFVGSVLVGLGYGFFAPWISTFEAFRRGGVQDKCYHCIVDGTWDTIQGSCVVVRDFTDVCYHSIPVYLKELREKSPEEHRTRTIRKRDIPACILVGTLGVAVEVPMFTLVALVKSPYMLFKGWQRLLQDLIRGEGPFLETACIPIAGLAIILWPLVVVGSIAAAFIAGIFMGLYGSIIVYEERSLRRGLMYLVAAVSEFDEYTNDWLYLGEGSIFPRPQYRKRKVPASSELSVGAHTTRDNKDARAIPPALLVPSLAPSKSVREVIQEVKVVQVWGEIMKGCEMDGKALLDAGAIKQDDLNEWFAAKGGTQGSVIGLGLLSYGLLTALLESIKAGAQGILMSTGMEINHSNRPNDRLLDWFFHPIMVLKEQIKIQNLDDNEVTFLEKLTLYCGDQERMGSWRNDASLPKDPLRAAQIQAISRRLVGISRSISKFPTYRRRFHNVVKTLNAYSLARGGAPQKSRSTRSQTSMDIVQNKV